MTVSTPLLCQVLTHPPLGYAALHMIYETDSRQTNELVGLANVPGSLATYSTSVLRSTLAGRRAGQPMDRRTEVCWAAWL